uniref:Uncharacterized protein n=1 Tax=Anopheles christyi TaxID=43041 RepID=A0A182KIJ5_9DIPT
MLGDATMTYIPIIPRVYSVSFCLLLCVQCRLNTSVCWLKLLLLSSFVFSIAYHRDHHFVWIIALNVRSCISVYPFLLFFFPHFTA